jgi:hypothetical protein
MELKETNIFKLYMEDVKKAMDKAKGGFKKGEVLEYPRFKPVKTK